MRSRPVSSHCHRCGIVGAFTSSTDYLCPACHRVKIESDEMAPTEEIKPENMDSVKFNKLATITLALISFGIIALMAGMRLVGIIDTKTAIFLAFIFLVVSTRQYLVIRKEVDDE